MGVAMEFKKAEVTFVPKSRFGDDMKRFINDEAARFTTGGNEAASSNIDELMERGMRFSKGKSKGKIKEHSDRIKEMKADKEKLLAEESIYPSKSKEEKTGRKRRSKSTTEENLPAGKECSQNVKEKDTKREEVNKLTTAEKSEKKAKSKETKKAAAKTALASVFQAKKELSNNLVGENVTGDALKDGSGGLMRVLIEAINPMRYVKGLYAKILGIITPYLLSFMAVFSILLIIVAFLFSVLQPLAAVGEALSNFMSIFTGDNNIVNSTISDAEIDEIVAASGADETREAVIHYALSKVGYPYSQENRSSGSAYDCSSLVYYAWKEADVDISFGGNYPPSAAEGARMLESHGKKVDTMELMPGDLIYYGGESNGRYLGIYHVAMYVGNGKVVEALNTKYGVVYQKLRTDNAIMVCRPE